MGLRLTPGGTSGHSRRAQNSLARVGFYLVALAAAALLATLLGGGVWQMLVAVLPLPLEVQLPLGGRADGGIALGRLLFVVLIVAVTYLFRRYLDGRSLESLGLQRGSGWMAECLVGFGLGALLMSLVLLVELVLGGYEVRELAWQQRPAQHLAGPLVLGFLAFVAVAFSEELVARGYILQNLSEALGRLVGVVVSSVCFALGHLLNPGSGPLAVVGIFFAGLLLAGGYLATDRLWMPMGLHLSWNFFQGPLLGFPVSGIPTVSLLRLEPVGPEFLTGGSFGPEASLIGVGVELLGLALLWSYVNAVRVLRERRPGSL